MKHFLQTISLLLLLLCGAATTGFSIVNPVSNPQLSFSGDTIDSLFFRNMKTGEFVAVGSGQEIRVWPSKKSPVKGRFKGVHKGMIVLDVKGEDRSFDMKGVTRVMLPSTSLVRMLGALATVGAIGALTIAGSSFLFWLLLFAFSSESAIFLIFVPPMLIVFGTLYILGERLDGKSMRLKRNWRMASRRKGLRT